MKRFILSVLLICFVSVVSAQTRYWVGPTTGGVWGSTANWSTASMGAPGASIPGIANDAVFDNNFIGTVEMDVLSSMTYTINSLLVTGNSSVTFQRTEPAGGTRVFELASTSLITPGLKIDNGSTLTIDAVNASSTLDYTLALTGAAGVTGEIAGNLYIRGTGMGTGGAEIDLFDDATHYAALTVNNLGVIWYFDDTGNTSPATGSYLTMKNGSRYEINKNGGSIPPGVWEPTSRVRIAGTGATPPIFNGNVYGHLDWTCSAQTSTLSNFFNKDLTFNNVNLVSTNSGNTNGELRITAGLSATVVSTLLINGNLTIGISARIVITSSSVPTGSGGKLQVKGNITNLGTITSESATAGTVNEFELNGTTAQTISNSGTFSGSLLLFIMNNSSGAVLSSPLTLPYNLALTSGKITTTSANLLTMIDNATYTGGSATSFVNGPMKKTGNDNFTFPVGKGGIYAPVGIVNMGGETITDEFTAEYKRTNPQSVHGNATLPGNDHVSFVEYWTLTHGVGAATKKVSLAVNTTSFCKVLNNTYVSRWNGSVWTNEGSTNTGVIPFPPFETGTITSIIDLSAFGDFTLITDLPVSINPLPIDLIYFNAVKNNSTADIIWELSACCSKDAKFELQKSTDGRSFSRLLTVPGSETNKVYTANDNRLVNGINYYRLKMTNADGKVSYSKTVAVIYKGILITSMAPNPVQHNAVIKISSGAQDAVLFTVYDMSGREVKRWRATIAEGNTNVSFDAGNLPKGVYQVLASTVDAKTVFRFIKQ